MINKKQQQLEREVNSVLTAKDKLYKTTAKDEKRGNASNTPYGIAIKNTFITLMLDRIKDQQEKLSAGIPAKGTKERFNVLQRCTGIILIRKKGQETETETVNTFNTELACHVALQMAIDCVMLPDQSPDPNKKTTALFDGVRPSISELQKRIGKEIHRQMVYWLLSENFTSYFNTMYENARGDTAAKGSTFYTLNRLDNSVEDFRDHCLEEGGDRAEVFKSDVFNLQYWGFAEFQVVGSWLLDLVYATELFEKIKSVTSTSRNTVNTIGLTKLGVEQFDTLMDKARSSVCEPLPMICQPDPITQKKLGGWLGDGAVLNTPTNSSWKGWVRFSDKHLDFYNHAQNVPFRINRFIFDVLTKLREKNLQLGKFKAYRKTGLIEIYKEPDLNISGYDWENAESKKDQDDLLYADPNFKQVKRSRSKRREQQAGWKIEGRPSELLLELASKCIEDEELFFPIEPDFRSRYTTRTSYLSYQGNDPAKALIEFAGGHEITDSERGEAKTWLSIHLANQAGLDKKSFATRIQWVECNLDVIAKVAKMLDSDEQLFTAMDLASKYAKDDEFKFIAACREYYELFIAKTRTVTYLPCAIDATCSGQQLIAGFLKDAELARKVNVLPTDEPNSIYRITMDEMLDTIDKDPKNKLKFSRKTRKFLESEKGTKFAKKGFISGQYGSGTPRQLKDMYAYLKSESLTPNLDDAKLINKYWPKALESTCKLKTVFNWFKELVNDIHAKGGTEVRIPTPTGSMIHQLYPESTKVRVQTFSFGSSCFKPSTTVENVDKTDDDGEKVPDLLKWQTATTANVIHSNDAALICLGLYNFEHSFLCVHDSISTYIGSPMNDLQVALREAYKRTVSFDLWKKIRLANGLPEDAPAMAKTLTNLDDVLKSQYMFC